MNYDSVEYISGCRNSMLTAIRRGDHDLAKSTFDTIWYSDGQRTWLKWRLPLMVVSEAYHLIGEYAQLIKRQKTSRGSEEKTYKTFIHILVATDKSKDVDALCRLSDLDVVKIENRYIEVHSVRQMLANYSFDYEAILSMLEDKLSYLSDYEQFAGKFLLDKIREGGPMSGIRLMLVCTMLICIRGLPQNDIKNKLRDIVQSRNLVSKIKTNGYRDFPWYAFDSKTAIGIQAAKNLTQTFPKAKVMDMCRHFEIDFIPEKSFDGTRFDNAKPNCFDNLWWPYYRKKRVKFSLAKWAKVQPQVRKEVGNLLAKLR